MGGEREKIKRKKEKKMIKSKKFCKVLKKRDKELKQKQSEK